MTPEQIKSVREAILSYYDDLSARKHGGVAQDKAFQSIQDALGMSWQADADHRAKYAATRQEVKDPAQVTASKLTDLIDSKGQPKIAPVQGYAQGIPWSLHLEAYNAYCKRYGRQDALIDLEGRDCRGGFGTGELDMFIPGWRDKVSEIGQLKTRIAELESTTAIPKLTVWEGAMPESNGKSNFTAVLTRHGAKGFGVFDDGFTIARSEYPDRVRYEADCVRYLLGELPEKPFICDYDADKHSGYIAPQAQAVEAVQEPIGFVVQHDAKGGNFFTSVASFDGMRRVYGKAATLVYSLPQPAKDAVPNVKEMVNRFLGWKLPADFFPDAGISFDRSYAEKWGMPVGTNLLTADQAEPMFRYCLGEDAQ